MLHSRIAALTLINQGFFQGGGGEGEHSPPLGSWLPPLRGPPITYSYSIIIFDIVHVESFPLIVNGINCLK